MRSGELARLLASAAPELQPRRVAVVALDGLSFPTALRAVDIVGSFAEAEGLTLYVDLAAAEAAQLPIAFRAAWITLTVHSALEAVGFTAAFSAALAEAGIACNVVAGARHDHLFVPIDRAEDAMRALATLNGKQQEV